MTDEQIMKAAGICRTPDTCKGCPYHELYTAGCVCALMKDVFDFINRREAKIKRLKTNIDGLNIFTTNYIKVIRLQAIKEFAELLKMEMRLDDDCKDYIPFIDKLVKDMAEENSTW